MTPSDWPRLLTLHARWFAGHPDGERLVLRDTVVVGADLRSANLMRARFSDVDLTGADFSDASFDRAEFERVSFRACRMMRADFSDVSVTHCDFHAAEMQSVDFSYSRVNESSFQGARMESAIFSKSHFENVSLAGADLREANLTRWELGAGCDLRECNLSSAECDRVVFGDSDLRFVNVAGAFMVRPHFGTARVFGMHGLPFVIDQADATALDFSVHGDGNERGGMDRLRKQLGGGFGVGRFGLAAAPALYRARRARGGATAGESFTIVRRSDRAEIVHVHGVGVTLRGNTPLLSVTYDIRDQRFLHRDYLVHDLLFRVLLDNFYEHRHRDRVSSVAYRNAGSGREWLYDYGPVTTPD